MMGLVSIFSTTRPGTVLYKNFKIPDSLLFSMLLSIINKLIYLFYAYRINSFINYLAKCFTTIIAINSNAPKNTIKYNIAVPGFLSLNFKTNKTATIIRTM